VEMAATCLSTMCSYINDTVRIEGIFFDINAGVCWRQECIRDGIVFQHFSFSLINCRVAVVTKYCYELAILPGRNEGELFYTRPRTWL